MSVQGWSVVVRDVRKSDYMDENDHDFRAPAGHVLIGRGHASDENGDTWYSYAQLVVVTPQGEFPTESRPGMKDSLKESSGDAFIAPDGQALIGRRHTGDENGITTYECASFYVTVNGTEHRLHFTPVGDWSGSVDEDDHEAIAPEGQVLIGRKHEGNETGPTWHQFAIPSV